MRPPPPTKGALMAALEARRFATARQELAKLLAARPKDAESWVCAALVESATNSFASMKAAIDRAAKLGAPASLCDILRAQAANGCGDLDGAIEFAERAARATQGRQRLEAELVRAESLFLAHRTEELARSLADNAELRADPRGTLLLARVHRSQGRSAAAEDAFRVVIANQSQHVARIVAGFELARLLDAEGRYREAFDAALAVHAASSTRFDTGGLIAEVEQCAKMAGRGAFRRMDHASVAVPPTALVCSLPRSGTTLVEQMLDRHPLAQGVGELPAVEMLAAGITAQGGWPDGAWQSERETLDRLQSQYLGTVRVGRNVPANVMTVDKTLHTWTRLPAIAAALPGAKLIRLRRDPRDTAVSLFFSNMHEQMTGWNSSLAEIRRVIDVERRCVPPIAAALNVELIDLQYEALVADPRGHLEKLLAFLGLPWHEPCLAPEGNRRVALTLSHEQVRRPINRDSLGRWKNYAEHFDASWEALAS